MRTHLKVLQVSVRRQPAATVFGKLSTRKNKAATDPGHLTYFGGSGGITTPQRTCCSSNVSVCICMYFICCRNSSACCCHTLASVSKFISPTHIPLVSLSLLSFVLVNLGVNNSIHTGGIVICCMWFCFVCLCEYISCFNLVKACQLV